VFNINFLLQTVQQQTFAEETALLQIFFQIKLRSEKLGAVKILKLNLC